MSVHQNGENIGIDRILRDMLAEARERRPERAWKESIMAAVFKARWALAFIFASMSAVVAVAALYFVASSAFTEATDMYARIALTGVVPALAILALVCAAAASPRVLQAPWGAAMLAILGSVATSVTYEMWYARIDAVHEATVAPLLVAACAAVALNGGALAVLFRPALRDLPVGAAVGILFLLVVFGGASVLLFIFPIVSTTLVAAGAVITVVLMRRAARRPAVGTAV